MPRVSEEHLAARRDQILVAARACFLTKGLHNTSMQDLVQASGLSVGAVYRYFKSKNEIIAAIASGVVTGIQRHIETVADRRLPLVESLELALQAIDQQLGPDGNFPIALQVWAEATIDPTIGEIVRERYTGLRAAVRMLVQHSVESGELPADTDVDAVTSAYFALLPGYALQRLLTGAPDRPTYLAGLRALINRQA